MRVRYSDRWFAFDVLECSRRAPDQPQHFGAINCLDRINRHRREIVGVNGNGKDEGVFLLVVGDLLNPVGVTL